LFFEKREEKEDFSIFGRIPMLKLREERGERIGTPIGGFKSTEKISRIIWKRTREERVRLNFKFLEKKNKKRKIIITKKIEWV